MHSWHASDTWVFLSTKCAEGGEQEEGGIVDSWAGGTGERCCGVEMDYLVSVVGVGVGVGVGDGVGVDCARRGKVG